MTTPQNNKLEMQILEYFENQENTEGKTPKEDTANILNIIASSTQPKIKDLKITYNGYTIEQLAEGWDNAIKERNELRDKLSALELERPDSVDEELIDKVAVAINKEEPVILGYSQSRILAKAAISAIKGVR